VTCFAEIDNCSVAYHRTGAGEPLLLVHGITTYSFIWQDVVPALAMHYDVIALDLPGCGESGKPLDISYAITDHADYIRQFVERLGITRFHCIGHDLGGGIGQIFAVRYPEYLYSLSLVNSVGYDFWPVQPISVMRTPVIRQFLMSTFDLGVFRLVIRHGVYHKSHLTGALMEQFNRPMQSSVGRKAFLHFARCLDNNNLTSIAPLLRQLSMPVLILRGDADNYLTANIAEQLCLDIPDSRLEHIATGGHFIQVDEPQWVAERLLNFLEGQHE